MGLEQTAHILREYDGLLQEYVTLRQHKTVFGSANDIPSSTYPAIFLAFESGSVEMKIQFNMDVLTQNLSYPDVVHEILASRHLPASLAANRKNGR